MAIESETELLTRLQKGEEAALLALLQRYQPMVWSICRKIAGSREDAEEATQDTFLKLLEKAHTFEGHSSLKTWIYRIAVNEALMRRRAAGQARETSLESLETRFDEEGSHIREIPDWAPLPEEILISEKQKRIIQEAIDRLPEAYRSPPPQPSPIKGEGEQTGHHASSWLRGVSGICRIGLPSPGNCQLGRCGPKGIPKIRGRVTSFGSQ